jgi:hypothetical protein
VSQNIACLVIIDLQDLNVKTSTFIDSKAITNSDIQSVFEDSLSWSPSWNSSMSVSELRCGTTKSNSGHSEGIKVLLGLFFFFFFFFV